MPTRSTRSGTKRNADTVDASSSSSTTQQPSKRSKSSDMEPGLRPQIRSKKTVKAPEAENQVDAPAGNDKPEIGTNTATQPSSNNKPTLDLTESIGDIFTAPPQTILIHACNCEGTWGAGIAAVFKKHYPLAFSVYTYHCRNHGADLLGTALLIPPHTDSKSKGEHFVGCLFTSTKKGRGKGTPKAVLEATGPAMRDLLRQVREWDGEEKVGEVRMCKINSGLFKVKWEDTKALMEGIEIGEGDVKEIKVVSREG